MALDRSDTDEVQ